MMKARGVGWGAGPGPGRAGGARRLPPLAAATAFLIALPLGIVALSTTRWLDSTGSVVDIHAGLWKACASEALGPVAAGQCLPITRDNLRQLFNTLSFLGPLGGGGLFPPGVTVPPVAVPPLPSVPGLRARRRRLAVHVHVPDAVTRAVTDALRDIPTRLAVSADTLYDVLLATRALLITAVVLVGLDVALACCVGVAGPSRALAALPLVLATVALVCAVVAVAIMGAARDQAAAATAPVGWRLGSSWVLALLCAIFTFVGVALLAVTCCFPAVTAGERRRHRGRVFGKGAALGAAAVGAGATGRGAAASDGEPPPPVMAQPLPPAVRVGAPLALHAQAEPLSASGVSIAAADVVAGAATSWTGPPAAALATAPRQPEAPAAAPVAAAGRGAGDVELAPLTASLPASASPAE